MVLVNYSGKEINAKVVYYGPGLCGKTTNLEAIYGRVPDANRGKMVSMKTRTERTLFFDFLPLEPRRARRIQDPLPSLHRAGSGLLQRHAKAGVEGSRRPRVRRRLPAREDGREHRELREPAARTSASTG